MNEIVGAGPKSIAEAVAGALPAEAVALRLVRGVEIAPDRLEAAVAQEAAVLGLLLLHPDRFPRPGLIDPGHYVVEQYARALKAMAEMRAEGGAWTPRAVADRSGVPARLLFGAMRAADTLVNLDSHIAEIRRAAVVRTMLARVQASAGAGAGADPRQMVQMLRHAADDLGQFDGDDDTQDGIGLSAAILQHMADVRAGGGAMGVSTGLAGLDRVIGGYRAGELVIIAARPGMGKTVMAVSSARASAAGETRDPATGEIGPPARHTVGFFSLEVGEAQTGARFLADQALAEGRKLPYGAMVRGDLAPKFDEDLERASQRLSALPLLTAFTPGLPLVALDARIEAWALRAERFGRPLKVVFIDYLKFLKASDRYKGNRVLEIGEITGGLKEIAARRGLCVVLLTQLNRQVEGRQEKRPTLSDLRDSGEIEQDADVVMMLYREAYYLRNASNPEEEDRYHASKNDMDVIVEKNRVGECTTVRLWCDVSTSSVRDIGFDR
ncbi:replicative DNA helicase [Prosthecomicrobium hirschii]|uniref:replicative DNA helicase n=1 Tax=Prosthecodimorpha hirschii TaxID=665126 RepID=UPI0022201C41|nr:DnaB-like helicase C-terminal domain-containing protein [Prosthecomicrobium hirschii]